MNSHPHLNIKKTNESGFTLIELMISITLGLLVVAATSQLFLGGVIGLRLQQAGADTQDNGLFGLDYIAKDVRLANYGNPQNLVLTDTTINGGIVLTADTTAGVSTSNFSDVRMSATATDYVPAGLLTHSVGDPITGYTTNQWQGLSKSTSATFSDQLTIQFIAPAAMSDCEGGAVTAGTRVAERYFLRVDANDANSLVLACDAGSISAKVDAVTAVAASGGQPAVAAVAYVPPILTGFGDAGQVVMGRAEHLHFLLGTQTLAGVWRYYTSSQYMGLAAPRPKIKSIQISALVRSADNTRNSAINASETFKMLDQSIQVATSNATTNRYVRKVYSTTIALRNGLGE